MILEIESDFNKSEVKLCQCCEQIVEPIICISSLTNENMYFIFRKDKEVSFLINNGSIHKPSTNLHLREIKYIQNNLLKLKTI